MSIILQRLKTEFPFVTRRAAGEQDFYDYCERHGVYVKHTDAVDHGAYIYDPATRSDLIFLNPSLLGFRLLHVMFHELGHQMFHVPSRRMVEHGFNEHHCRRNHAEAEQVAAYLLLTEATLTELLSGPRITDERLGHLITVRLQLPNG